MINEQNRVNINISYRLPLIYHVVQIVEALFFGPLPTENLAANQESEDFYANRFSF
jgi:hypothetical protein